MKKKYISLGLTALLLTSPAYANPYISKENPKGNISREEMAVISSRILKIDNDKANYDYPSHYTDVKGWSSPYINMMTSRKIMVGSGKNFRPKDNMTHVEVLTTIMRAMGYKDGVDFIDYPSDYYNKAIEIGLANMYIPHDKVLTREEVSNILDRYLEISKSPKDSTGESSNNMNISLKVSNFNTNMVGIFQGKLSPNKDYSNYKIQLLSNGKVLDQSQVKSDGSFNLAFTPSFANDLFGYEYKLYEGEVLILNDQIQK